MHNIRMVDLKAQYENIKHEVDNAIQDVIDSTAFINGPHVKDFQNNLEKYLGIDSVIPCANGTDALQIALMALELEAGDEVITPDFTFISTVEVVKLLGLKPRLVDVDPETFTIDIDKLEKTVNKNTKAIVPVHLFGQCADMNAIMDIAEKYNISVVEDVAQATGAEYNFKGNWEKAGTIGHIGCTSFFPSKNLGCYGDGGALFTNDSQMAQKIRTIANHGSKVKYYHDDIGVNSRLDTLQAAILNVKLKYLDNYNKARQKAAAYYDEKLGQLEHIQTPVKERNSSHIYHQYTLVLDSSVNRNDLKEYLKEKGIPSMVYYPVPMHKQSAYVDDLKSEDKFPVSERLSEKVLSLPMHTELTTEQLEWITTSVINYFK